MTKGERLESARNYFQLSQKEMAIKLNVQQGSYSRMENNKSGFSESTILILGELGISSDWLLFGRGEMLLSQNLAPTPSDESEPEPEALMEEMEERVRRIRIDVSDIEDTLKKMLGRRRK